MLKSNSKVDTIKNNNKISIINYFFNIQINIKVFHFLTNSYAKHKATDNLYNNIENLSDRFIETYIGLYGRPNIKNNEIILYKKITNEEFIKILNNFKNFLYNDIFLYIKKDDTDILNIRDEIVSEINKTLYLFTLE